jgi:hypothetical protein
MKWYHFTRIDEFRSALEEESLSSLFERTRKKVRAIPVSEDVRSRLGENAYLDDLEKGYEHIRSTKPDEYDRNNFIWFTSDNSRPMGERGNDIVMGFEIPHSPNKGQFLILPEVSLDSLVYIGVIPTKDLEVKRFLFTSHNGKYANTPVYLF